MFPRFSNSYAAPARVASGRGVRLKIAGAGPLVGPVLAAQFGYLPGTLWIVFGVVLGGELVVDNRPTSGQ